jgi:hypothetical protein
VRTIDSATNADLVGEPDPSAGELVACRWAPPEAYATIDDVEKFALSDDDYEDVMLYRRFEPWELEAAARPDPQAVTDAALCEIYEMLEAMSNG